MQINIPMQHRALSLAAVASAYETKCNRTALVSRFKRSSTRFSHIVGNTRLHMLMPNTLKQLMSETRARELWSSALITIPRRETIKRYDPEGEQETHYTPIVYIPTPHVSRCGFARKRLHHVSCKYGAILLGGSQRSCPSVRAVRVLRMIMKGKGLSRLDQRGG